MKAIVPLLAGAALLGLSTTSEARCYYPCNPGQVFGAIMGGLAGVAIAANAGRYIGPPQPYPVPPSYPAQAYAPPPLATPSRPRSQEAWKAWIMRQANEFCAAYPADESCQKTAPPQ